MKSIVLLTFSAVISLAAQAQMWRFPNLWNGAQYSELKDYKKPHKCIEIDSSKREVKRTYMEFDERGNMITKGLNSDTLHMVFDEYDYPIVGYKPGSDTVYSTHTRDKNKQVIRTQYTAGQSIFATTDYIYDKKNLVKTVKDSLMVDETRYDSQDRKVEVKSYGHNNHGLSVITLYQYPEKNKVTYQECSYDENGKRYDNPCNKRVEILNDSGKVIKRESTFYPGNDNNEVSIEKFYYNSNQQIEKIETSDRGKNYLTKYYYNNSGILVRIEFYEHGKLFRQISVEVLE